jgi:TM2 domain-containing membrane protein YozV
MPAIIDPEPIPSTSARTNVQAGACPLCGAPLHNPEMCDRCDWVKGYGETAPGMRQNPRDIFAGILSLFWPGAGHFYKGHTPMAIVLAVLGGLCFLWSITFFMFFGFLALPAFWIGVAANAYFLDDLKHPAAPAQGMQAQRGH